MVAVNPIYALPAGAEKGRVVKLAQFNLVRLRKTWKNMQQDIRKLLEVSRKPPISVIGSAEN